MVFSEHPIVPGTSSVGVRCGVPGTRNRQKWGAPEEELEGTR